MFFQIKSFFQSVFLVIQSWPLLPMFVFLLFAFVMVCYSKGYSRGVGSFSYKVRLTVDGDGINRMRFMAPTLFVITVALVPLQYVMASERADRVIETKIRECTYLSVFEPQKCSKFKRLAKFRGVEIKAQNFILR